MWSPRTLKFSSWSPGALHFLARSPGVLNPFGTLIFSLRIQPRLVRSRYYVRNATRVVVGNSRPRHGGKLHAVIDCLFLFLLIVPFLDDRRPTDDRPTTDSTTSFFPRLRDRLLGYWRHVIVSHDTILSTVILGVMAAEVAAEVTLLLKAGLNLRLFP